MAKHKDLQKAIRQMADGSKSAFHTFYLGSAQFVYSSARLLYSDHAAACRFMVDFYQYLYLHLPEYKPSEDLEKWISRLIMDRFSQLSIGRNRVKPSVQEQMHAGTAMLETAERERVWRLLEERMHFPKEDPINRGGSRKLLLVPALLLAVLLIWHYRKPILEKLQNTIPQEASDEQDENNNDAENDNNGAAGELPENKDTEVPVPDDNAADLINGNDGGGDMQTWDVQTNDGSLQTWDVQTNDGSLQTSDGQTNDGSLQTWDGQTNDGSLQTPDGQTNAPNAPNTPTVDTPSSTAPTVDEPTVDTPTVNRPTVNSPISEQDGGLTGSDSGSVDLEHYELEPYYGDSLTQ